MYREYSPVGSQHPMAGERRGLQEQAEKKPCQEHTEKNQPESQGKQVFVGRGHDQGKKLLKGQEKMTT